MSEKCCFLTEILTENRVGDINPKILYLSCNVKQTLSHLRLFFSDVVDVSTEILLTMVVPMAAANLP